MDLRFEESRLSGLKVTLGNVAQHMGHGTWHQENQGSAQAPELAQDRRYLTPLCQSNISSLGRYFEVSQCMKSPSHGELCATNIWAQLCMGIGSQWKETHHQAKGAERSGSPCNQRL